MEYPRLSKLYELAEETERNGVHGSIVECGVWHGGSAGMLAAVSKEHKSNRHIWLFDSFEGLPEPGSMDVSIHGKKGKKGAAKGNEEEVWDIFLNVLKIKKELIHVRKGWFRDTVLIALPDIGPVAFLHIDCDWEEWVKYCLQSFYKRLTPGGVIVIDDYNYLLGCKKAVDEFIDETTPSPLLIKTAQDAAYFRKI